MFIFFPVTENCTSYIIEHHILACGGGGGRRGIGEGDLGEVVRCNVSDPQRFDTEQDPRIRTNRVQIRIWITALFFSGFQDQDNFFFLLLYLP